MKIKEWTRSDISTALTTLYLRLNGYFLTGLIITAATKEQGQKTDIDCLAVRFPQHAQPEREEDCDPFILSASTESTDLILCEIKASRTVGKFNDPIKTDIEVAEKLLSWAGFLSQSEVRLVAPKMQILCGDGIGLEIAKAGNLDIPNYSIRALLSCPAVVTPATAKWCLTEKDIFGFAQRCFDPERPRRVCSPKYDYELWGPIYSPIVKYIKRSKNPSFAELYNRLKS